MSDFIGMSDGVYGGIAIHGYGLRSRVTSKFDTDFKYSTSLSEDFDTESILNQGVILVSPPSGSTRPLPITLSWGAVSGMYEYQLQISLNSDFSIIEREIFLKTNSIEIDNLPDGKYYWRVRYR